MHCVTISWRTCDPAEARRDASQRRAFFENTTSEGSRPPVRRFALDSIIGPITPSLMAAWPTYVDILWGDYEPADRAVGCAALRAGSSGPAARWRRRPTRPRAA